MPRIVVLDGYTLNPGDNPWTEVERLGELTVYDRTPAEQIVERAVGADVVLTNKTIDTVVRDATIRSVESTRPVHFATGLAAAT